MPRGKTPTAGRGSTGILSRIESTQPTVPSPPQANNLIFGTFLNNSIAGPGPPWVKSKTYNICIKFFRTSPKLSTVIL